MRAAQGGHAEVVVCLLQAGADAGARNSKGRTALDIARASKADASARCVEILCAPHEVVQEMEARRAAARLTESERLFALLVGMATE